MVKLFIDCDGVLANFDKLAEEVLGMHPRIFEETYGSDHFWGSLELGKKNFFAHLEPINGALLFFESIRKFDPIVLTGAPLSFIDSWWDKPIWVHSIFGVKTKVAVCQSKNKSQFCKIGDVLVDDFTKYQDKWVEAGGRFVHHTSFEDSLKKLREMGFDHD